MMKESRLMEVFSSGNGNGPTWESTKNAIGIYALPVSLGFNHASGLDLLPATSGQLEFLVMNAITQILRGPLDKKILNSQQDDFDQQYNPSAQREQLSYNHKKDSFEIKKQKKITREEAVLNEHLYDGMLTTMFYGAGALAGYLFKQFT